MKVTKDLVVTEESLANEERIPLILSGDIRNEKEVGVNRYTSLKLLQEKGLERKILERERVLLAKSRLGTAGRVVGIFRGRAIHNNGTVAITPHTPLQVQVNFLFYYLRSIEPLVTEEVVQLGKTSINTRHLHQIPVPVPPSEVQQRIVSRLDAMTYEIQRGRKKAQEVLTTIEKLTFPNEQTLSLVFRMQQMQAERETLLQIAQRSVAYFGQVEREVLQRAFRGAL